MTDTGTASGRNTGSGVGVADIGYDEHGLVPVVVQSTADGAVLMLAYANRQALSLTLETREAHYYSRSRSEIWRKGATSGNTQRVVAVRYDCDADALLYLVEERGPACHTGERTCFYRALGEGDADPGARGEAHGLGAAGGPDATVGASAASTGATPAEAAGADRLGRALAALQSVIAERLVTLPEGSYVRKLHERGVGYVAQKVVEEAGETVVAALLQRDHELVAESADLLFHLGVLLTERGVSLGRVADKLDERRR